jgi:hypothetical protein
MLSSSKSSSTPVIVNACGLLQFDELKVMLDGETVPSAVLLELNPIVTFAVG